MQKVNVNQWVDQAEFNKFHGLILFWCAAVIIFDGYDLAVAGIALPSIMQEMGVDSTKAGFMVSSALVGMMFGNILFGALADKIGRKAVIAICIFIFSVFTAAAGLMKEPVSFSAMRFLAGVGIGGVMPCVIAQMSEYAPLKIRSTLVTMMFSGYSVGGMLAALLGKGLIVSYGWQGVFFAAAFPIVLIPFMWMQMPESLAFLAKKGRHDEMRKILQKLNPNASLPANSELVFNVTGGKATNSAGSAVSQIFADGRTFSTFMFWTTCFMCLFMVYALSSWLTKLMASAGYSLGSALTFVLVLNIGAMIGAISGGWLADRFNIKYVLIVMYILAALSITALGYPVPTAVLFLAVAVAGGTTIGAQIVTCAYCSQYYPLSCRSTAVGLMLGVGRAGAILAPIVIGVIVGMNLPLEQNFLAIAFPALIAAISIGLVSQKYSNLTLERVAA